MFGFFRKRAEQKRVEADRKQVYQKYAGEMENGKATALEMALFLHLMQQTQESYTQLLVTAWSSDVFTFNKGPERFRDAMLTQDPQGRLYVACFTSDERIGSTDQFRPFDRKDQIPLFELIFALGDNAGIVLNPMEQDLNWTFTPEDVAKMKVVIESSFNFEVGVIYSVRKGDAYAAAKLLRRDEQGVHVRIYGNRWQERPTEVEIASLSMASNGSGKLMAYGHLPIATQSFLSMGPRRIGQAEVDDSELEGYKIWQENNGGYFGA